LLELGSSAIGELHGMKECHSVNRNVQGAALSERGPCRAVEK